MYNFALRHKRSPFNKTFNKTHTPPPPPFPKGKGGGGGGCFLLFLHFYYSLPQLLFSCPLQIELTPLPSPLPCSVNNGGCPQLCLASNSTHRLCGCSGSLTCNETCECITRAHCHMYTSTHVITYARYNMYMHSGDVVYMYM